MNDDLYNKLGGPSGTNYNGRRSNRSKYLPILDHLDPKYQRPASAFEHSNQGGVKDLKPAKARVIE